VIAWVGLATAGVGLVTALVNGWLSMRHRREDDQRFADVHDKLNGG
jgi:hypothetical protein